MLHPHTELRFISDNLGSGVFATRNIPAGTIVFVSDDFDRVFTPDEFESLRGSYRELANTYSYRGADGNRIMSWDLAKYVNHSCEANVLATAYDFEIAVREIGCGEQITVDYGLFNICEELYCGCGESGCRGIVRASDIHTYAHHWDEQLRAMLRQVRVVEQPLWSFLDRRARELLAAYLEGRSTYQSVTALAMPEAVAERRREAAGG